jgi:hypothetical protein
MRKLKVLGLALFAMFAFSVVAAGTASAEGCHEVVAGNFETQATCEAGTPEKAGPWELTLEWLVNGVAVTGEVAVDSESVSTKPLELEDMGTGVKISCEGTDKGTVGPNGKDKETVVTENLASCKVLAGSGTCKKILAVKAVDLPWATQLRKTRDEISAEGAGSPGWLVECEGFLGIKVDDTCTLATGTTAITNLGNGTVESLFDGSSGEANCSVGGEKQGLVIGPVILLTESGLPLAAS